MRYLFPALFAATPALSEPPRVVTDIPPVHALVSQVMEGVGTPTLLLRSGDSAHGLNLRPSQARETEAADLIFWIGPAMSPALARPFETLGEKAKIVALMEQPGSLVIDTAEAAPHKHEPGHDHEEADGEDEHDAHDQGHDGHDHGTADPHLWLDPANARTWLALIAEGLSAQDPENASKYATNAEAADAALASIEADLAERLTPLTGREYIVTHRAFAYFEARFGLSPAHALSGIDAATPGPRAMEQVRHAAEEGITCLIAEPETSPATVKALTEGTALMPVSLDPLGRGLPIGPTLYTALLREIAEGYESCLK